MVILSLFAALFESSDAYVARKCSAKQRTSERNARIERIQRAAGRLAKVDRAMKSRSWRAA